MAAVAAAAKNYCLQVMFHVALFVSKQKSENIIYAK